MRIAITANNVICLNSMKISILAAILLFFTTNIKSQNLRDLEHSLKFANYLFASQQYELSAEEYEHVVFLDSSNNLAILRLLQAYRLSNKSNIAEQRFNSIFADNIYSAQLDISKEHVKNLIINKKFADTYNYIDKNPQFNSSYKETHHLACLLLQKKKDLAFEFAQKHPTNNSKINEDLHLLAVRYKHFRHKKPYFAAFMSAIIPGAGKAYSKNWKDGIISFLFVGLNSWQAYRGFKKYGNKSAYGWVFLGLATSFYLSNIFGSHKAAKKYNHKFNDEVYKKTWDIIVDNNPNRL